MSLFCLSCWFGLRPEMQRDGVYTGGLLYIMQALADAHSSTVGYRSAQEAAASEWAMQRL